jgi:hypothetical protein
MSKAEKFINDCTRNCSNVFINPQLGGTGENHPWLTPDQARKAVEIAREEMIDKFCEWVKKNVTYIHPRKGTEECVVNLGKLKEAMKDE